jgi:carbonic anhydrase
MLAYDMSQILVARMDIMGEIRLHQARTTMGPPKPILPKHEPEMLYIGCIDARLDPINDIGIEKGKALIFRNIGALVPKDQRKRGEKLNRDAILGSEIPASAGIGATLEFFLNHLPDKPGKVKHIVVGGHTDCGGLQACQHGVAGEYDYYLPLYLDALKDMRAAVMKEAEAKAWDSEEILRALEEGSVRQSMTNLLTYPAVCKAIEDGRLEIHGWVINTASQRIKEMNPKTWEFEPMPPARVTARGTAKGVAADRER